jgi:hypothetical protein
LIYSGIESIIKLSKRKKEHPLARDNYSYKKYQRELAKKQKIEEKKQRKLEKKALEAAPERGESEPVSGEDVSVV